MHCPCLLFIKVLFDGVLKIVASGHEANSLTLQKTNVKHSSDSNKKCRGLLGCFDLLLIFMQKALCIVPGGSKGLTGGTFR